LAPNLSPAMHQLLPNLWVKTASKTTGNMVQRALGSYGPFSVQAKYLGTHYDRSASLIEALNAPGDTSVNFSGCYVYATWYLTGESRAEAYMTYPKEYNAPATFGQIHILHPVSAGGTGAWEAAVRFDEIMPNINGIHPQIFEMRAQVDW
jgi:phosphate-selective porin